MQTICNNLSLYVLFIQKQGNKFLAKTTEHKMNKVEQSILQAGLSIDTVGYKDLQSLFPDAVQGLHKLTHDKSLSPGVAKAIEIPEGIRAIAVELLQSPYLRGILVGAWCKCNNARLILDKDPTHVVITIGG